MAAKPEWQKAFKGLEVFEDPRRIVEQYEFRIGGLGPIPIVVYETMEKEFEAVTPGWKRFVTEGTGMSASEIPSPVIGTGKSAQVALEKLLARIPAIQRATWKRVDQ